MADMRETQQKLKIAISAMLVVDAIAVALLISPLIGSARSRKDESQRLWRELQLKTRQVEPLKNIDEKIIEARKQIDEFYEKRFPAQNSSIYEELGKLAGQSGVKIGAIKYKAEDPEPVGLRPIEIEADFTGDYLQLMRFINSLERDPVFFIVDSVQLGGEQGGLVRLQLKLETYLKASS